MFIIAGWVAFVPAALLILRLLWEKTLLTWEEGEQTVGLLLLHQYPILFSLGITALVLCDIWIIIGGVYWYRRRTVVSRGDKIQFVIILLTLLIEYAPNALWIHLGRWLDYIE